VQPCARAERRAKEQQPMSSSEEEVHEPLALAQRSLLCASSLSALVGAQKEVLVPVSQKPEEAVQGRGRERGRDERERTSLSSTAWPTDLGVAPHACRAAVDLYCTIAREELLSLRGASRRRQLEERGREGGEEGRSRGASAP